MCTTKEVNGPCRIRHGNSRDRFVPVGRPARTDPPESGPGLGVQDSELRSQSSALRGRASGVGGTQHAQMPAAPDLRLIRATRPVAARSARPLRRARGLTHGVRQGFQIVAAGPGRRGPVREPDDLPATGRGESLTVFRAQVVAVGLGIRGERTEDRGRIGIDVRQCRDSGTAARGARTATYRAHDVGRYRTLERAATTLPHLTPPCRDAAFTPSGTHATALTCAGRRVIGQSPLVIQSPLGANPANEGEFHDPADVAKRAQAWPECSICDMTSGGPHGHRRGVPRRATLRQ